MVDDELVWLRSISRALTAKGYEVVECSSGHKAIELLKRDTFDVLLSDIGMPGLDGMELLKYVRSRELEIPVVLVTGEPAISTAIRALEFGAFHYLTKPVSGDEVERVLDRAVRMRRVALVERRMMELLHHGEAPPVDIHRLAASFNRALDSLWMAYQPIVKADDHSVYGYEALLRSTEPSLPHPGAVIEAAERLGHLNVLGRVIRDRATEPIVGMPEAGVLFVNLHTDDLLDDTLFDPKSALSQIASRVVLEITERASLERISDLRTRISALRAMGFRIAVDDLGAGYAGLTSFALLEPEIVKLDMSLVRDVHLSSMKQKLIRSISSLCQDMGMLVVAEGVETVDEREVLVSLGCDLFQGYLLAKPGKPFPAVSW